MGITNVRYSRDILKWAGSEHSELAVFPDLNKGVNIVGRYFEQEELDSFGSVLRYRQKDVWLFRDGANLRPGRCDDPVDKPSVYNSSGLNDRTRSVNRGEEAGPKPELAYVLIIRGRSAALYSKVRILYTLQNAASAMFEEAVNGYSTVFSAAILKDQVGNLSDLNVQRHFQKVDTVEELYASTEKHREIAFLCGGKRFI